MLGSPSPGQSHGELMSVLSSNFLPESMLCYSKIVWNNVSQSTPSSIYVCCQTWKNKPAPMVGFSAHFRLFLFCISFCMLLQSLSLNFSCYDGVKHKKNRVRMKGSDYESMKATSLIINGKKSNCQPQLALDETPGRVFCLKKTTLCCVRSRPWAVEVR